MKEKIFVVAKFSWQIILKSWCIAASKGTAWCKHIKEGSSLQGKKGSSLCVCSLQSAHTYTLGLILSDFVACI